MREEQIARDLLSIRAVFFRPDEPFTWASGIQSPVYCDNRLTLSAPAVRRHVEQGLAELVREGKLSPGHARALLGLKSEKLRKQAAQRIIALQLSVRQAETLCKNLEKPPQEPEPAPLEVDYVAECEKSLSRRLGRKVRIVNGKRKGRFELEFYGQEDLNRLLFALQRISIKEEPKDE